jgi:hypothetical protein
MPWYWWLFAALLIILLLFIGFYQRSRSKKARRYPVVILNGNREEVKMNDEPDYGNMEPVIRLGDVDLPNMQEEVLGDPVVKVNGQDISNTVYEPVVKLGNMDVSQTFSS